MGIKIGVVGGASSYTPELFANLIDLRERLAVDEVALADVDSQKLALIARVSERPLKAAGLATRIRATLDRGEAIRGADFVILQVRVGGLAARVRDERLPMEYGMVGNETTGAGGFACALRTVPLALEIARDVERLSPRAWLLNLTNPAGIVTEALLKHAQVRTIGFCNIPINTAYGLAELLHVEPHRIQLDYFGLNHLSWVREVYVDGEGMLGQLMAAAGDRSSALYRHGLVESLIDPEWLRALGMIPGWYLRYFYYTEQVLEEERRRLKTEGEEDMVAEERLREIYTTLGYDERARQILEEKGGARYYLPVLQVMDSIVHDGGETVVVDTRNGVALPDLPAEVCVEVPARIGRDRIEPVGSVPMPPSVRGLVQAVKTYEELAVEAAVSGDEETAVKALVAHPLVGSYPRARAFLDRVLENERPYLSRSSEESPSRAAG